MNKHPTEYHANTVHGTTAPAHESLARDCVQLAQWLAEQPHGSTALNNLARQMERKALELLASHN